LSCAEKNIGIKGRSLLKNAHNRLLFKQRKSAKP